MENTIIQHTVLDEIEKNKKPILFSKLSIFITCIVISPYWGAFLYCGNLRLSDQKNKINRTFITISISYLMVVLPLMGFEIQSYSLLITHYFSRLIISLLIILFLWKKQFDNVEYKTTFPWIRFIIIILIQTGIIFYRTYSSQVSHLMPHIKIYYIDFSLITTFAFLFYFTIGDFIYRLVKKAQTTNNSNNNRT